MSVHAHAVGHPGSQVQRARALFAERSASVLAQYDTVQGADYYACAVQYARHHATARTDSNALTLLAQPSGDVFWMLNATCLAEYGWGAMPGRVRDALREAWRTYAPYRGDTENHWCAYYAALLLATQRWPSLPGSAWFNGRSSDENHADARAYLMQWMRRVRARGLMEFDSPIYLPVYASALLLLHDHARERDVRAGASALLAQLVGDFAAAHLDGMYAGALSRSTERTNVLPKSAPTSGLAWLWFGAEGASKTQSEVIAALSSWRPSDALLHTATVRHTPRIRTKIVRTRTRLRYGKGESGEAVSTLYMTRDFALGSLDGGLLSPIQQHTWGLVMRSDDPSPVIFGVQPYWSERELGMYFPEEPKTLLSQVAASKGAYVRADKREGGSPYERVRQHGSVLAALYDIPAGAPVQHADLLLPRTLDTLMFDASGWIFFREGGTVGAAFPLTGCDTLGDGTMVRVRLRGARTAVILDIRQAGEGTSLAALRAELVTVQPRFETRDHGPEVRYQTKTKAPFLVRFR